MAKEKRATLTTPVFRVGFPHVFEKSSFKDGKPKYNLIAIFTPKLYVGKEKERWDALLTEVNAQCLKVHGMSWADAKKVDPDTGLKGVPDFKDGLYNGMKKKNIAGFGEGTVFCTLSSLFLPGVVKYNGPGKESTDISVEDQNTDEIYAGIFARATVGVYAYNEGSVGVSIGLNNLQKVKDGERLDGRGNAADSFEDDVDGSYLDQEEPAVEADPFG